MTTQIETVEHLTGKAVRDVFQKMLSMDVSQEPPVSLSKEEAAQIIGSVGFAGEATGIICLYVSLNLATVLTSRMLGITEAEVDSNEMVNDAIGELTNMIVGFVKSNLSDTFRPPPKVDSAVIRLIPRETLPPVDPDRFLKFVSRCFQYKRKTIRNNLLAFYEKEKLDSVADVSRRAEQLSIDQFIALYRALD